MNAYSVAASWPDAVAICALCAGVAAVVWALAWAGKR